MNTGPSTRIVKDVVSDFVSGDLAVPDYQREYCWNRSQAEHFLERTQKIGHVLGAITSYRLTQGTAVFLQDGLQRITTLRYAIETPTKYKLLVDDVKAISQSQVSQQSMIYDSHDEARLDFQHLNQGVGLIAYEKFRGDLEKDDAGKKLYGLIRNDVDWLSTEKAGCSRASKHSRKKAGQLHRNSLGLFYQYCTRHKEQFLYVKSSTTLKAQIERRVREWLEGNLEDSIEREKEFVRSLERVNAILKEKTSAYPAKQWDLTAVRGLYAAYIHCRNIGCTTDVFIDLVDWFVSQNINRKKWSARFDVNVNGIASAFRMDQISLKWLFNVVSLGGPEICVLKRVKNFIAPAGYDVSHVTPHADGGTETVIEPAMINRARGRQPIL